MLPEIGLAGLNHLLSGEDWARSHLMPFSGQTFRIEVGSVALRLAITPEGLFRKQENADIAPAVTLSLPAEDDSSQTRVLRVDKSALRAAGFRYISLNALRGWYERHPERQKNAFERLVSTSSGSVGPAGRMGNVLRTGPEGTIFRLTLPASAPAQEPFDGE